MFFLSYNPLSKAVPFLPVFLFFLSHLYLERADYRCLLKNINKHPMATGTCQHWEGQQIWETRMVLVPLITKYSKCARDPLSSTKPLPSH